MYVFLEIKENYPLTPSYLEHCRISSIVSYRSFSCPCGFDEETTTFKRRDKETNTDVSRLIKKS